jgi:hypothetical protein
MTPDDYLKASARTASGQYHTELVSPSELDLLFRAMVTVGGWADRVKRALFYGKPNPEPRGIGTTSFSMDDPGRANFVHALLGMITETAEMVEHLQAVMSGTKEFDTVNAVEESGDMTWYLAMWLRELGVSWEQVWTVNIDKLVKRFPDKFTEDAALNRDLDSERKVLENGVSGRAGIGAVVVDKIAIMAHNINRAYCQALGDDSIAAWEYFPTHMRQGTVQGVLFRLHNQDATPEQQHAAWMSDKLHDGWVYGESKDLDKKTHPCIVPYEQLPEFQRVKDKLFQAAVDTAVKILT